MKRTLAAVLLIVFLLPMTACYNLTHVVGTGGEGTRVIAEQRQWFAIFGLIDMNDVDSKEMSDNVVNYTVVYEMTTVDFIKSILTSLATIQCCTVRVID